MSSQPHPAVLAVHEAANTALDHQHTPGTSGSFWKRWFDSPEERHFADIVRTFVVTLDLLLDVPPTMLTLADLAAIGEDVNRVIEHIEAAIDEPGTGTETAALAPAIYAIRTRHEELYQRGAAKTDYLD
jgi:hypothetical protein